VKDIDFCFRDDCEYCASAFGPSFGHDARAKAAPGTGLTYDGHFGRRLPMTAFEELSLNETRGKYNHLLLQRQCSYFVF